MIPLQAARADAWNSGIGAVARHAEAGVDRDPSNHDDRPTVTAIEADDQSETCIGVPWFLALVSKSPAMRAETETFAFPWRSRLSRPQGDRDLA